MEAISEGLQNYLEAILLCEEENRVVRIKDLADKLGVKSPSAHAAIKELAKRKYVEHESYRHIELTPSGRKEAESIYSRHLILRRFFIRILGLPSEISDKTACGIEHHIDDMTLKKITNLFTFLEQKANNSEKFAEELEEALKND
jgi:DtxR family Mn-dependent transcriptional regulator